MSATEFLSAREVAGELGVSERTVRRWIVGGDLAAEKHGGRYEVRIDEAREVFSRSRAARPSEQAEFRGRYLEAKERLERVEAELSAERERRIRLELVLWPLSPGVGGDAE